MLVCNAHRSRWPCVTAVCLLLQAQAESRKAAAALDAANKQIKEKAKEAGDAQARAEGLQAEMEAQAEELAKLQDERAPQRILLPVGMEEELDAPMTRSPRKGAEAVTSNSETVGRAAGAFRPAAGGGPALLGSNFPDYSRAFAQGASGPDGGGLRLGAGFSEASTAAAWGPGKPTERLLHGLAGRGAGGGAGGGRVGGGASAVPGTNPAAKPFVATKQRGGAVTSAGMPPASEAGGVSGAMHGMQRPGLSLTPGHEGMPGIGLMGAGGPRQAGYGMQPGQPLMSLGFFDPQGDVSGSSTAQRAGGNAEALSQGGDLLGGDVLGQGGATGRGGGAGPPLMQGVAGQMHPLSFMMSPSTQKPPQNIWGRPPGASHYG